MELFVVIAYDATEYRLTRVFDTEEKAKQFKQFLIELLWKKVTIDKVVLNKDN